MKGKTAMANVTFGTDIELDLLATALRGIKGLPMEQAYAVVLHRMLAAVHDAQLNAAPVSCVVCGLATPRAGKCSDCEDAYGRDPACCEKCHNPILPKDVSAFRKAEDSDDALPAFCMECDAALPQPVTCEDCGKPISAASVALYQDESGCRDSPRCCPDCAEWGR